MTGLTTAVDAVDPPVLLVAAATNRERTDQKPIDEERTDQKPIDQEPTGLVLAPVDGALPLIAWVGPVPPGLTAADVVATVGTDTVPTSAAAVTGRAVPLLAEVSRSWFGQPGLRGYRVETDRTAAGRDWSTQFVAGPLSVSAGSISVDATDAAAGLGLRTELQAVAGGALRIRHILTNRGSTPYVVEGLDVTVPVPDRAVEVLDLTGRWGRERVPQRHRLGDGVWLREGRTGKTGHESATLLVVGTGGFGFRHGEVWGVHAAWSGNTRHSVERQSHGLVTLGAGELLLPGEMVLPAGASYATPWVFVVASAAGLDGLAARFHDYERALPAHPASPRPVVGNVWEAVYFDHDAVRLSELADLAAEVGIERFVLDDGWFGARRHDRAGLGDWVVSDEVWPEGLTALIEYVESLGMQFGLWFEPEMVNADSDLYRAHPDWILATGGRVPPEARHQLVLDLGRAEVREYLLAQMDHVLSTHSIRYVKWDHNRSLVDAGSAARGGGAGVHDTTAGFYLLLDELRRRHPGVEWESCASGGGRIDLGVLERTERVWTSDMTDALSRQVIQRWTAQLVAPEYLGAHVSADLNHQTGRRWSLDFRAATAFFGDFGVEWDLSAASAADRARLAGWISLYKRHRALLHSGRVVRVDSPVAGHWIHGVVAADRSEAVFAYVQLDETVPDPVPFVLAGLDPTRRYTAHRLRPDDPGTGATSDPGLADRGSADPGAAVEDTAGGWRGEAVQLSGAVLHAVGLPAPPHAPATILIVHLRAD